MWFCTHVIQRTSTSCLTCMLSTVQNCYRSKGLFCKNLGVMSPWLVGSKSSVGLKIQRSLVRIKDALFFFHLFFRFLDKQEYDNRV